MLRPPTIINLAAVALLLDPRLAVTAEAAHSSATMAVSVTLPRSQCFERRVGGTGTIAARHAIELRPDRDGLVVSDIFVEPGDFVGKGQVLARLVSPQGPLQQGVAVKAPVDGALVASSAVQGAFASSQGKDPLFRIAEGGDLELRAEVLAGRLAEIREGMPATLAVVGLGDVEGHVAAIGNSIDAATQVGTVRIAITDTRPKLGQYVRAAIRTGEDCGLSVPLSALLFGNGTIVGVVRSGKVVIRRVRTGLIARGEVEIRDGLENNDAVIVRAGPFLREGDQVRSVEAAP